MDARSIALLEFPQVRARLAEKTSFDPSRRLAEAPRAVERPGDRRAAASTRPTRPGSCSRSGPAWGSARRTTSSRGSGARRAAAGSTRRSSSRSPRRSTPPRASQTSLAEERRPLLRDLGRRVHPLPALRSTLARSFDPVGELLDTASPRLGPLRGAVRVAYDRLRRRLDSLVGLGAGRRAPGADRHDAQRALRGAGPRGGPRPGEGHRPRRVGQRPDAVRGAARRRGAGQRVARGAGRGRRGGRPDPRRAVSALVGANATMLAETLEALAQFDFWAAKAQLAAEMDGDPPGAGRRTRRSSCSRRATRGSPGGSCRSTSGSATATRRSSSRAPTPAARRSRCGRSGCSPSCTRPGSTSRPRRARCCRCSATCSPTSATSSRSPSRCRRSRATCARSSGSSSARARARSSCSTSWAPAPTPPRAPRSPRRCSTTSSGPARSSRRRPTTPRSRSTPTRRRRRATRPWSSTSRRCRRRTGSRSACPGGSQAFAIAERLGLPDAIVDDAREPAHREPGGVRGDARVDPDPGARDRRGGGPGPGRRAARDRGAAHRRGGAPQGPARARRGGPSRPGRGGAARGGAQGRRRGRPPPAGARDRHGTGDRRRGRPRGADARPPARSPPSRHPRRSPAAPRTWRLGDRARSRNGGWEGRIAALEKGGTRATLEAGGMRVSVAVEDLEEAVGGASGVRRRRPTIEPTSGGGGRGRGPGSGPAGAGIGNLQLTKARSVASSLDLRGARVDEALEALDRYLDDASLAGLEQVLIIHGLGTGALRDAVRAQAGAQPAGEEPATRRAGRGRRRGDDRPPLAAAAARAPSATASWSALRCRSPLPGPPGRCRCRSSRRAAGRG